MVAVGIQLMQFMGNLCSLVCVIENVLRILLRMNEIIVQLGVTFIIN